MPADPKSESLPPDVILTPAQATWTVQLNAATLILAGVFLLFPTVMSLGTIWSDTAAKTYTHGPLVAVVCLWLLWQRRQSLAEARVTSSWQVAAMVAVLSCVWVIAYRAGLQLVHQMIFPALVWLSLWAALGPAVARQTALPIGYLYFALPFWSAVNGILQALTILANRFLLTVGGIPAHVEGNLVHIPSGTFEIAGGCSGLHFFIVAIAIAVLYGELHRDRLRVRLVLIGLAAAISVVTNWIRVFVIIVAGHLTDMEHYLVKVDHYYFGWVLFAVGIALFLLIARRIPSTEHVGNTTAGNTHRPGGVSAGMSAAIVTLAIGPALLLYSTYQDAVPELTTRLPVDPGDWAGPSSDGATSWQPRYRTADVSEFGEYRDGDVIVAAFHATYWTQSQGKELVGYDNSIIGESGEVVAYRRHEGTKHPVNEIELASEQGEHAVVWYFYKIGERVLVSDLEAQLLYGVESLFNPTVSQVIALRAACDSGCNEARGRLERLLAHIDAEHAG